MTELVLYAGNNPNETYTLTPLPAEPRVAFLAICEVAMSDEAGMLSLIRIIDRFTVEGAEGTEGGPFPITFAIAFGVRNLSPDKYPTYEIFVHRVRDGMLLAYGQIENPQDRTSSFDGKLKMPHLPFEEVGAYALSLTQDRREVARTDFEVVFVARAGESSLGEVSTEQ